jgi:hypothetical protein
LGDVRDHRHRPGAYLEFIKNMKATIRTGKHRAWPPSLGLYYNKKSIERIIIFNATAKYDHPGEQDDDDVNKLFGIGFFPGHHTDSARFGWTYNNNSGRVALWAYCYVNGVRSIKWLCEIKEDFAALCKIEIRDTCYTFTVKDALYTYYELGALNVPHDHDKKLAYPLCCYFGGNNPAPHDITIQIKRK